MKNANKKIFQGDSVVVANGNEQYLGVVTSIDEATKEIEVEVTSIFPDFVSGKKRNRTVEIGQKVKILPSSIKHLNSESINNVRPDISIKVFAGEITSIVKVNQSVDYYTVKVVDEDRGVATMYRVDNHGIHPLNDNNEDNTLI